MAARVRTLDSEPHSPVAQPTDVRALVAWFLVGAAFCAVLQVVFWLELGGGLLLYPFIWAYSQAAWLQLIIRVPGPRGVLAQAVMWAALYAGVALFLWRFFPGKLKVARYGPWATALLGWTVVQLLVMGASACALYLGIIDME